MAEDMRPIGEWLQNVGKRIQDFADGISNIFVQIQSVARKLVAIKCEASRRLYEETGNPLYAWEVYRIKRDQGEEVPEWVLEYLDRASRAIGDLEVASCRGHDVKATAVIEALEMKNPGRSGRGTVFTSRKRSDDPAWLLYSIHVAKKIQAGDQETYAIEAVAQANGVNKSTVWRHWQRAKKVTPEMIAAASESPRLPES